MIHPPVDLPGLSPAVTSLPEDIRRDLGVAASNDLYLLCSGVLGMTDMTPEAHGALCTFADVNPFRFKEFLMPRGHLKTSIITKGRNIQKVVKNPEVRILLANETATNAERFLTYIKSTAESNKIFRSLYSHIIPKTSQSGRWSSKELVFNRQGAYSEPTIDTIGMTGAYTSRHYTHLSFDDLVSEEAAASKLVMEDVIARFSRLMSLFVDPEHDTMDLTGTRWAFYDVYSYAEQWLGPQLARFVRGAIENGEPIWPQRYSMETLATIRNDPRGGEYAFSCLYMNNPRNPELQDFNVQDIRFWRWATDEENIVLYNPNGEIIRVVPVRSLDIVTTVDARYGEKLDSDRDAVVTTGCTLEGDAIVLDVFCKRSNPLDVIEHLIKMIKRYNPRVIGIPKVGYEMSLKYHLGAACEREGVYANVVPVKPGGPGKPHIRGLQPVAATGHLYVLPTQHALRTELAEYPLGQYDDAADALALQTQLWQGLLSSSRMEKYKAAEKRLLQRITDYGMSRALPGDPGYDETEADLDFDEVTNGPIHEVSMN